MKDIDRILVEAKARGWTWKRTKDGHYLFRHPSGRTACAAGTPSDRRSWANTLADLRRAPIMPPPEAHP